MLENSLPTNFVGKDGFYWWIGQVEKHDVKNSNRFKVRIVGHHLRDCNAVAVDDLPWAITMLPVTTPYRTGNSQGASANLRLGDWVVGFFMDGADGQQPVIMGSVGATANATKEKPSTDPNPGGCKAFTTYLPSDHVPGLDEPNKNAKDKNKNLAGTHTAHGSNAIASEALLARCGERSAANPFGTKFCVSLSDGGKCDNSASSKFERILSELMLAVQDSGGQLGSYLINKYTGGLYSYVDQAQGAINKIFAICKSLLARLKGELVKLIRQGVDSLLQSILTPKSGGLKKVVEFLKKQLEKIGCTIDGLLERLLKFLTDLIMGYVMNIINAAFCQVENFLNTLISQLQSMMNSALQAVLGPLQSILGAIAAPLNLIGQAMSFVMNLLGITCTGLSGCNKEKESCTDGKKKKKNFLDDLLAAIEDGELAGPSYCEDALTNPPPADTDTQFVGGTPAPNPTTGTTPGTTPATTPAPAATYTIAPSVYTVAEGGTVTYTISTTQIPNNTTLYYNFELNNNNNITSQISGPTLTSTGVGSVSISNNTATITITITDDTAEEEADTLRINLEDKDRTYIAATADVTIQASDPAAVTYPPVDPIINSTLDMIISGPSSASPVIFSPGGSPSVSSWSISSNSGLGIPVDFDGSATVTANIYVSPASALPSYTITADKTIVLEGETITFTVNTTNVPDNTILNFTMFGLNITASDFYNNTTTGYFYINNGVGVVPIVIAQDTQLEGLENCTFALDGTGASIEFYIKADPPVNQEDTFIPAFVPPTACPAQVDASGKILSIDICDVGDPYLDPPTVVISGSGFGAAAVAELDDDGYIAKVNILRPGLGYQENDNGNRCILTNIIPISVGFNFTSVPTVYIDGDSSVARAKINGNGQVIGFEIIDKTRVYTTYPTVEIFGEGTGATAIAKIDCYPDETIADIKRDAGVKQTGSYIDCP